MKPSRWSTKYSPVHINTGHLWLLLIPCICNRAPPYWATFIEWGNCLFVGRFVLISRITKFGGKGGMVNWSCTKSHLILSSTFSTTLIIWLTDFINSRIFGRQVLQVILSGGTDMNPSRFPESLYYAVKQLQREPMLLVTFKNDTRKTARLAHCVTLNNYSSSKLLDVFSL